MHDRDCLHRFLFEPYPIRAHIAPPDASWRALLEHRDYPPAIRDTLGEAVAAAGLLGAAVEVEGTPRPHPPGGRADPPGGAVAASVLLAATLKFEGTLSLQLQGQGPMHLMLAQCSSELGVRAVARYREAPEGRDLAALSGEGNLTVTLENEDLSQRYQGIVPLSGARLADCLREYFESSQQLPTRLWLHAPEKGPQGGVVRGAAGRRDRDEIDYAWRRVQLHGDTLRAEELQALSDREILRRLFAEDDVRLFESTPVFFRCQCSRERVIGTRR